MKGFLVLLYTLFIIPASAQWHEISGVVLDGESITLLPDVNVILGTESESAITSAEGKFTIHVKKGLEVALKFQHDGYQTVERKISSGQDFVTIFLKPGHQTQKPIQEPKKDDSGSYRGTHVPASIKAYQDETYEQVPENKFRKADGDPFSTFTLNADHASYSNIRRFIQNKRPVPPEAVRIEELINYFQYDDTFPDKDKGGILSQFADVAICPWYPQHWLMRLAIQAKTIPTDSLPPSNLVLLVDISGSMSERNKLPLLKIAFRNLVSRLGSRDSIAIVVYAGQASIAMPTTSGEEKRKILDVINNLHAGGSTAGKSGIEKAFKLARDHFIPKGNNRVIMATDGDFNVGKSSDLDMRHLISRYRGWGIYLTCIGVGMGNYKDSKLETLARWGQGNFAYLDNEEEAKRIFNETYAGMMMTLALKARMKVIFNPRIIQSYRLIGYQSHGNGGRKAFSTEQPGGVVGCGQRITAYYVLVPTQRFIKSPTSKSAIIDSVNHIATSILQYQPLSDTLQKVNTIDVPATVSKFEEKNNSWRFGAAVTLFGMLLRHSDYIGDGNFGQVKKITRRAKKAVSKEDYKAFMKLIQKAADLTDITSQ